MCGGVAWRVPQIRRSCVTGGRGSAGLGQKPTVAEEGERGGF